ncbi:MAG: diaminopimelate decarboxylase [Lachnospiraceae bacterium]|nr:diaminopimelate decarboxylase [Lachnospiraceae bacterium]
MLADNITAGTDGRLRFAGHDVTALAKEYGTPLFLLDEDRIRDNCREYKSALATCFGNQARPLYAGKALAFRRIYEIMKEEDMGIDVVSSGELYTALQSGYDVSNAYFHGNNKTDADIRYGIKNGTGCFVVDNVEEICSIEREAAEKNMRQKILIRLTPGIDPHTFAAVATGKVDSKFGNAIETGQAEEIAALALTKPHVDLYGFHCHIGSQIFDTDIYLRTVHIMLTFIALMKNRYGFETRELDLGGGFGVRYTEEDPEISVTGTVVAIADTVKETCARLEINIPALRLEPGRSIVADAGMTLYTVGSVKTIPGYKNYVSVDGGMTDNPRFALYGSRYTCLAANKTTEEASFPCDLAGRCCESGDIIQANVLLPQSISRGDLIAVCTTGAYNYAMASNYNRIPRPPVIMLSGGNHYIAVRRERFEDLVINDV